MQHTTVVFDLGGVLVDWNPRYLYRKLFDGDEAAMEDFLTRVCTPDWNTRQDAGRSFSDAYAQVIAAHPEHKLYIESWLARFDEMLAGPIHGSVEILAELRARGTPLYALSNWSAETFPHALRRFDFLNWFHAIVLSGDLKLVKPDPRIFQHLLHTHGLTAAETVFIDDTPDNVAAGAAAGMHALHFTDPARLRRELTALGLL